MTVKKLTWSFLLTMAILLAPVAQADFNGDGIPDAFFQNWNELDQACLGDGEGGFSSCTDLGTSLANGNGIAAGDLDGDGFVDVLSLSFFDSPSLCFGDGTGAFPDCTTITVPTQSGLAVAVALGDLDDDGHLDAVFGGFFNSTAACLNDGDAGFSCTLISGTSSIQVNDIELGDMDGDGFLDVVVANLQPFLFGRVCLNDGAGGFGPCTVVDQPPGGAATFGSHAVELGDLDGDGNLDAFFEENSARLGHPSCLNDGDGNLTCTYVTSEPHVDTRGLVMGDVNDDGDLDIVILSRTVHPTRVCLGDGDGGFGSCSDVTPRDCDHGDLVDLDRDGDLDLLLASWHSTEPNLACFNDGFGNFTCEDSAGGAQSYALGVSLPTNASPTAACRSATVSADGSCRATVFVEDIDDGSSDPDGVEDIDTICISAVDGVDAGCLSFVDIVDDLGQHELTLRITDALGKADSCVATVDVVDTIAPDLTCPPRIRTYCNATDPSVTGTASAADNCDDAPSVTHVDSVAFGCPTIITRTWTATDVSGNTVSEDQSIHLVDRTAPSMTPSAGELACVVENPGRFECFTVSDFAPEITDDCAAPVTWRFVDCRSSQPPSASFGGGPDCTIDMGGGRICVLAERDEGDPAGRRYAVTAVATDLCGNESAPTTIGFINVPLTTCP